jgi:hypothetical protein
MQIVTSKTLPSIPELVEVLKQEFSNDYSYKLFGVGQKSIMVGKSALVGAQISIRENEMVIQATPPSIIGGIVAALGGTELGVFLLPIFFRKGMLLPSQRSEVEKEIGIFLKQKYN